MIIAGLFTLTGSAQSTSVDCDHMITQFQFQTNRGALELQWSSASALPSDAYFTIERSADGNRFETIGSIKLLVKKAQYQFSDLQPLPGPSYYRIQYRDPYLQCASAPLSVQLPGQVTCKLYPNPVHNNLLVQSLLPGSLELYDALGNACIRNPIQAGGNAVDMSLVRPGTYLVIVFSVEKKRIFSAYILKQ